jgi:hypothetical protein
VLASAGRYHGLNIGFADVSLRRNFVLASPKLRFRSLAYLLICLGRCGCVRLALPPARRFLQRFPRPRFIKAAWAWFVIHTFLAKRSL